MHTLCTPSIHTLFRRGAARHAGASVRVRTGGYERLELTSSDGAPPSRPSSHSHPPSTPSHPRPPSQPSIHTTHSPPQSTTPRFTPIHTLHSGRWLARLCHCGCGTRRSRSDTRDCTCRTRAGATAVVLVHWSRTCASATCIHRLPHSSRRLRSRARVVLV